MKLLRAAKARVVLAFYALLRRTAPQTRAANDRIVSAVYALVRRVIPAAYASDGLISVHSHSFMQEAKFLDAYARGVKALGGVDTYQFYWRVHVGLWVASIASQLDGDFVECGVNKGFMSSAIMENLDWNSLNRDFYLLDTFAGLDERFVSDEELSSGAMRTNEWNLLSGYYIKGSDSVRENFAEWQRVHVIEGTIPDTLTEVESQRLAYLHIDLNCAPPEIAAIEYFWDKLTPGAPVLLDDYAYFGFTPQKLAMDEFARTHGVSICSLPTGQGLLIKPPPLAPQSAPSDHSG
jgi:hypothetical protein